MEGERNRKICPHCKHNLFPEDVTLETECKFDNDTNSKEWCDEYEKRGNK